MYFLLNLYLTLKSIVKILLGSKLFRSARLGKEKRGNKIIILGNGPSLNDTLRKSQQAIRKEDLLCVNAFSLAKEYTELQPRYYVIADPQFWRSNPIEGVNDYCDSIINAVVEKTTWPLTLFAPYDACRYLHKGHVLFSNLNIKIIFYNKTTVRGFNWFSHFCYKRQLGMPRPQNVLVPSIMLALNMGYKEVYITGADHSWHETLEVNNENILCIKQFHFYEKDETIELKPIRDVFTGRQFFIHQQFESLVITFKNYHIIEHYAKSIGIKIYNASAKSFIDAFERKML
jgi:hypothetical protein